MESMRISGKNESMGNIVFPSILFLIIFRKHGIGKIASRSMEIYANEFTLLWFPGSS